VLEVCTLLLGPAGPGFLAEMGAEVIKCEFPPMGDTCRDLTPFGYLFREQGPAFAHMNTNKYWLGLDLHLTEAQEVFRELAAKADIIENNLRPGVMESWNIGYRQIREINPRIIYIAKNGFGQWGQYARENRPSNDGASQAFSGYAWLSSFPGQPPLKSRLYICDNYGALTGELAVLAALHHREKTGKGQFIELSQSEAIMRAMSWVWPYQQITGKTAMPSGNRDLSVCPADTFYCADDSFVAIAALWYQETGMICERFGSLDTAGWLYCFAPTKDGAVFLGGLRLEMWQAFADMLGKWDEWDAASWTTLQVFMRKDEQLKWAPRVFAETRKYTNDEPVAMSIEYSQKGRLAPITTVVAPVCSPQEAMEDANWLERGMFTPVKDPVYGEVVVCQAQHKMTKTPIRTKWVCQPVGYDNERVYKEYMGFSPARLNELKKASII